MNWLRAFFLVVIGAFSLVLIIGLLTCLEDFLVKHLGKVPNWLAAINAIIWLFLITKAVKDHYFK